MVFSPTTGDIQLNNKQSNGNLNTRNIVGGRMQNQIKNSNTVTRNVFFDRRFAQNNLAPPWFPSTTLALFLSPCTVFINKGL